MFLYLSNADTLEEIHGGAKAGFHAADEQSGPSVYYSLEINAVDTSFPEKEGEDWDD